MQPLELLNAKIAGFPGYADDLSRERSDELVRSYLGEALSDVQVRLQPLADAQNQRIGDLLMRTGFVNQEVYRAYEDGARTRTNFDSVAAADARVIELADRAATIDASNLSAFLDEIVATLDARDAAMDGAPAG
ncbi:MAG TPA: hypothetical protein VGF86_08100 [Candidatus Tumulicola sp.]|jgi:hypothetical protein